MSATILAAVQVLESAERQLREQMQAAAAQGEYETLLLITSWAKRVGELGAEAQTTSGGAVQVPSPSPAPPVKLAPRKSSKTYPKFFRNGHGLVKIGWSKSEKAEYEHRAPIPVLDQVVAAIERASKRQRFAMDDVLATIAMPDGTEIPSYQTYLCLAWLRYETLVLQHGRQGYSVKPGLELATEVRARFSKLPEVGSRTPSQEEKTQ
jgi:hypothetical protein